MGRVTVPFSILTAPSEPKYCAITDWPEAMRNPARPGRGDPMQGTYPSVMDLQMSSVIRADGLQVPDVVDNAFDWLIVSERLKDLLEKQAGAAIEFLPFRLLNHKGRVAAERIWAVNVLGTVDCADRARSIGTDSEFDDGELFDCEVLALDERKIPRGRKIFRTALFPPLILVRDDLRALIEAERLAVRLVRPGEPLE